MNVFGADPLKRVCRWFFFGSIRIISDFAILCYRLVVAAVLAQLNVSPGGMPKLAVARAKVSSEGVEGDWQTNRKYHGGPNRAVCLFSLELYQWLRDEHAIDMAPGSVGENFTTSGIDLQMLNKGDRLRVGNCVIELTD